MENLSEFYVEKYSRYRIKEIEVEKLNDSWGNFIKSKYSRPFRSVFRLYNYHVVGEGNYRTGLELICGPGEHYKAVCKINKLPWDRLALLKRLDKLKQKLPKFKAAFAKTERAVKLAIHI